jgi:hypothetical protein
MLTVGKSPPRRNVRFALYWVPSKWLATAVQKSEHLPFRSSRRQGFSCLHQNLRRDWESPCGSAAKLPPAELCAMTLRVYHIPIRGDELSILVPHSPVVSLTGGQTIAQRTCYRWSNDCSGQSGANN